MKLSRRVREPADINLTPLIDVVFLLLIFFMVSTTFNRDSELSIELPQASAEPTPNEKTPIDVAIDAQGRIFVAGRPLAGTQKASVKQALSNAAGTEIDPSIVISADANTAYQAVVTVMDAARELGYLHLRLPGRMAQESQ